MNPDPLTVIEDEPLSLTDAEWKAYARAVGIDSEYKPELPRRRDARLVLLAFAGMALIAAVAWMLQQ